MKLSKSDVFWGGRVRSQHQTEAWRIATENGSRAESEFSGNMVSSSEQITIRLLDGHVQQVYGAGRDSGMWISGDKVKEFIFEKICEKIRSEGASR